MLKLSRWLKKKYKKCKPFETQWPPCHGKKLVKLQLVENDITMTEEQARLKQRGREDKESMNTKRTMISFEQIFTSDNAAEGEKVLLEGDAGIGKSTFCTMFAADWANDEEYLKQFTLLLFIPLHDDNVASSKSLSDLLRLLHHNETVCSAVTDELEETGGENVLLLADGWDELGDKAQNKGSFLYNLLIDDKILPSASVLVTSRPSASVNLHDKSCGVDRFVEVVGFNRENIKEYVESELAKDKEKCSNLLEQLESNHLIESICSVPLNCAIVCELSRTHENLPHTMTELYTDIISQIIFRNIAKLPQHSNIMSLSSLNSLPSDLQENFWKLCEFAFKAIEMDQIVFSQERLQVLLREGSLSVDKLLCFGLLQRMQSILADEVGFGHSFNFLHLTFQEYLAAYHLARQSPDKQLEICVSYAESPRFGMVWRFFFGISCTQALHKGSDANVQLSQQVIAAFVKNASINMQRLLLCHCSFESGGNGDIIRHWSAAQPNFLQYCIYPRTAHDCAAVISVMSNVESCDSMYIHFSSCSFGDKGIKSLTQVLASSSGRLQVSELYLSGNRLTDRTVCSLFSRAATSFKSLNHLHLSQNPLEISGIKALEDSVRTGIFDNIEHLSLAETLTTFADTNAALLTSFLEALSSRCCALRQIILSKNTIGESGMCLGKALSQWFGKKKGFTLLDLREIMLGDEGMCTLVQNIQATSYLNYLYLGGNNIHSVGISSLASSISSGVLILTDLFLDNNPLGLDGVVALGRMLSNSNCHLEHLSLENCQLTTRSIDHSTDSVIPNKCDLTSSSASHDTKLSIANVRQQFWQMSQNNTLVHLNLDQNNFSDERIEVLAGLVFLCKNLEYLTSRKCNIALKSFEQLFHCLDTTSCAQPNFNIRIWYLNDNIISNKAVNVLIEHFPSFPHMEHIELAGNPCDEYIMGQRQSEEIEAVMKFHGVRVVRGHDWQSGDEDGGEGYVGTVVDFVNDGRRVVAQWDCGNRGEYCCGMGEKFELKILDNLGLQHVPYYCDSCDAHPIIGYRWQCVECNNYDLCTSCYMAGKAVKNDSQKHEFEFHDYNLFLRGTTKTAVNVRVPPRAGARRVEAKGIFPGAEVVRGPDWYHGEEDGGDGEIGIVNSLCRDYDRKKKHMSLEVKWISTNKITTHPLGLEGKAELKCVTAASGGYYYPDHLPILGATKSVQQEHADMIRRSQHVDSDDEGSGNELEKLQHVDNIENIKHSPQSTTSRVTDDCGKIQHRNENIDSVKTDEPDHDRSQLQSPTCSVPKKCEKLDIDNLCLNDLKKVRTAIWEARVKWYDLGVELEVSVSSLMTIKADNFNQSDRCFTAMLTQWLQSVDPKPTWTSLITALKSPPVNHPHIAEEIQKKYCTEYN